MSSTSAACGCASSEGGAITITNSPRVSASPRIMRGERGQRVAPHFLVQLGQFAADRGLARAEGLRRDRRACRRCAVRIRTGRGVAGMRASSAMRARRCVAFGGRKPSKKNRSVGSPETVSAVSTDDAPGIAMTARPASCAARTSLKPGSEISGVPASEISATAPPSAMRASSFGRAACALCS